MLGAQEVEYLGFILKGNGVTINPHKIDAVKLWKFQEEKGLLVLSGNGKILSNIFLKF